MIIFIARILTFGGLKYCKIDIFYKLLPLCSAMLLRKLIFLTDFFTTFYL